MDNDQHLPQDRERIRLRAYFLWDKRTGKTWWDPVSNWLEAEACERQGLRAALQPAQRSDTVTEGDDEVQAGGRMRTNPRSDELRRYRLLARQPLAVTIEARQPFTIAQSDLPLVSLRAAHADPTDQMRFGGTSIELEFETAESDLLKATSVGVDLIESVLAALALYTGVPFEESIPTQLLETTPNLAVRRLLMPLHLPVGRWDTSVDNNAVTFVRSAIAHWDALDTGHRLRRAAKKYAQGLALRDPADSFQLAYVGLEVLEKPLALEFGIAPGVEEMTGTCAVCKATYKYNKTTLAAVKRYVTGAAHPEGATRERIKDWKDCSGVRHDLVHGLKDLADIEGRAYRLLPALFHYLHDASVHLAHAHALESERFQLAWPRRYLLLGQVRGYVAPIIGDSPLLVEPRLTGWIEDQTYGMVPEFEMNKPTSVDIGIAVRALSKPMSDASEADLEDIQLQRV